MLQAAPSEGGICGDVKVKPKEARDHRRKEVSGTWTAYERALERWSCVTTPSKVVVRRATQPLPQPGQSGKLTLKDSTFAPLHFGFVCSSLSFVFSCSSLSWNANVCSVSLLLEAHGLSFDFCKGSQLSVYLESQLRLWIWCFEQCWNR